MQTTTPGRKVFVSYKYKDWNVQPLAGYTPGLDTAFRHTPRHYVDKIIDTIGADHIYKGEMSGEDASHLTDDTIDSKLKEKIFDSSVTVVLISPNMKNLFEAEKDQWIPNEIAYSLRNKTRGGRTSTTNGIVVVALPDANGSYDHAVVHQACGVRSWQTGSFFKIIGDNMFNRNSKNHAYCNSCYGYHHNGNDHSYFHPVKWVDFIADPNVYIEHAVTLRDRQNEFNITKTHK